MAKDRFKTICAVYLLLFKEDAVLLLRRCGTGYHDGDYSLPAGHLETKESLTETLFRETKEEIGIDLNIEKTKLVHVMHRSKLKPPYFDFFFSSAEWKGTPSILEPNKCDDLQWFPMSDLPTNIIPYIRSAISAVCENKFYSENS